MSKQSPLAEKRAVLVSIGASHMQNRGISKFARQNSLDFMTYTEDEWATLEEIDQYIQEEELSKQIINLPIGSNQDISLDQLQKTTIKKIDKIKNISVNKMAKKLKIGRASLYRKMEKHGIKLKSERKNQTKKAA